MHGVARVRPKIHDLENVMLTDGRIRDARSRCSNRCSSRTDAGEPWLALELPAGFDVAAAGDHLLYAAIYPTMHSTRPLPAFGGLLLDEWTEVIPGKSETAALAFHYDRPSHEPPQTLLLVTPAGTATSGCGRMCAPRSRRRSSWRTGALVQPRQIAERPIARFFPATLMAFTTHAISISSELRPAEVASSARRRRRCLSSCWRSSTSTMTLLARMAPAITQWDRVDGIPRTHDMARALRAEVSDPLWMLARQWQMGELIGDDAGSPVFAKLHLATTRLTT